jgi:hypothetical protein
MFDWLTKLTPGEQLTLCGMAATAIFNAGMYLATIRSLTAKAKEHDGRLDRHDGQIQEHGEDIAALKAGQEHGRA